MTPHLGCEWEECFLFTQNHREICDKVKEYSDVLFVFPLYVDSLPCCVLEFLDCLCQNLPDSRPTVHLMINCGFLETEQNSIAIKTLQFFCKKYGFPFGSCLSIGSGEAILTPPFDMLFKLNLKKLAKSIKNSARLHFRLLFRSRKNALLPNPKNSGFVPVKKTVLPKNRCSHQISNNKKGIPVLMPGVPFLYPETTIPFYVCGNKAILPDLPRTIRLE